VTPEDLEAWRRERGWTLMQASQRLGCSHTHLRRLEKDQKRVDNMSDELFARVLAVYLSPLTRAGGPLADALFYEPEAEEVT
jgi:transcriptional regulator with XRE-family HTH domain